MLIKDAIGKTVNDWSGIDEECDCGERHKLTASFFIGSGAEDSPREFMEKLAPPGCGAVLLREADRDADALCSRLRRLGYTVYEMPLVRGDGFLKLESEKLPDSVRAVLGFGGGFIADCAKYLAAFKSLPCGVVVRSHASPSLLVPSASIDGGGMPRLFKTGSPKVIVCDPDKLDLSGDANAAAFGEISSRLLALFDWKFAALIHGEKLCETIYDAALGEVDGLLKSLRGMTRRTNAVSGMLLESGLKLSALAALDDSSRLYGGGDTACALALEMLTRYENGYCRLRGENELLFSMMLADVYPKVFELKKSTGFLPPPDNNMRLEKLKEYFGIDEQIAARSVTPYQSDRAEKLCSYRIGEYEDELRGELERVSLRLSEAYRIFRRLYADDGFSLRGYLGVAEARLCIGLAPEMHSKFTTLTELKNMGALDGYLID